MIYLDTNIFLRFLVVPVTDQDRVWHSQATTLMEGIESGSVHATTSEMVIHEVCYVLGSRQQYGMEPVDIVERVRAVLLFTGMRFDGDEGGVFRAALDCWQSNPKLGFSDSVIAARCERAGHELAAFDRHFADLPFLQHWRPETTSTNAT
ncbi:MAG: type II toxin-antitoxin system VapC family toxin [Chloroflexia bacterium]|nr:type II toxin-antitoxin system VapC family toxin [Chloroflexia bacterium]